MPDSIPPDPAFLDWNLVSLSLVLLSVAAIILTFARCIRAARGKMKE